MKAKPANSSKASNAKAAPRSKVSKPSVVAAPKSGACACGCGGKPRMGKFLPGHDAILHSMMLQAEREGISLLAVRRKRNKAARAKALA